MVNNMHKMLDNITCVIFDMDGSLIDSMWVWQDVDKAYLSQKGFEPTTELLEDIQFNIQGMSFDETAEYFIKRFNLADPLQKIRSDWNNMAYERYKYDVKLKPGAREFLEQLKDRGIKMGIATANSRELVDMYIEVNRLGDFFGDVKTGDDIKKGKPAPDIYLSVAGDLNVSPDRCLVFEDIVQGIQAGLNAGMRVCAVLDSHTSYQDADKRRLAHYCIKDFTELL